MTGGAANHAVGDMHRVRNVSFDATAVLFVRLFVVLHAWTHDVRSGIPMSPIWIRCDVDIVR